MTPEAPRAPSYWESVWAELLRRPLARLGLRALAGLLAVAVAAPLLSSNQPLYWNAGEGHRFPLASALLNRLYFENAVDLYFNLALLLAPLAAVLVLVARRRGVGATRRTVGALLAAHGLAFALSAPASFGPLQNPLRHSGAVVNYRLEAERLREEGREVTALFPLRPYGYRETDPTRGVRPPGRDHWLGTDTEGRDVFSRMVFGTRISLTIGVVAVSLYVTIGVVLGALAGYFGGAVDAVVSRLVEVMICFPSFFLILTLAALVRERSIFHVMVIIGVTSWTSVARLVRAEFLRHRSTDWAQAAVALGIPRRRILFAHILPNALGPVLVSATFGVASAILIESSLSFLGLGDLSVASWGETLNAGRVEGKLWLILAPGLAIFTVVTLFNLVGEGVRDALDPRQQG